MLLNLRYLLEYALFRLAWGLLRLIPEQKAYSAGLWLGRLGARLVPKRKRIAVSNILAAGITKDAAEAERIAVRSMGHFIGHILETIRSGDKVAAHWRDHVAIEMSENWLDFIQGHDKPFMIVSGHLGTWEVAVPVISSFRPMIAIAQTMQNPYVARFMQRSHFRGRITVIGKERGFSASVIRQWQREKSALTILMDQRASGRSGVRLPFFGRETFVYTSPARIALKSGCPMIFGAFVRDGLLHYRMYSTDPLEIERTGDFDEDVKRLTALLLKHLEGCIRRWPEQYLWMHNRWKA